MPDAGGDAPDTPDVLRVLSYGGGSSRLSGAGRLLEELIAAMYSGGAEAQDRYDEILYRAREMAGDIVVEIARAEGRSDPHDYSRRWALIHAAGELHYEGSVPFLKNVVMTPIPPEEAPDPHTFSTVTEETILRTTAIDGLERLAADGSDAALDVLLAALEQPSLSVRRAAVQGVLATTRGEELRDRVAELLPEDQRFLLEIKRAAVQEIPQVRDPRAYLADDTGETGARAPLLPEDDRTDGGRGLGEPPTTRS